MSGTLRGLRGAAQVDKHPAAVPVDDLPALQTGGVYHGSTPGVIGFERAYEEDNIDPLYNSSDTEV